MLITRDCDIGMILSDSFSFFKSIAMRYWIIIGLLLAGPVYSDTSLWRVSNGANEIYIGGTIHLLGRSDYPLPEEFDRAFREADKLILEADLSALSRPEVQMEMLRRLQYSDGTTLRDVLEAETFAELGRFCSDSGIPIESMLNLKPPMVAISLMMIELQRLGLAEAGVDHFFDAKARAEGKAIDALETLETQLKVLENMGQGKENELISSTLKDVQMLPEIMGDLKNAWFTGDLDALEEVGIAPMRAEFPELYRAMLVDRNNVWLTKITEMLATPERELVLVGALHLAGREGIVAQLRERGYTVERFRHAR